MLIEMMPLQIYAFFKGVYQISFWPGSVSQHLSLCKIPAKRLKWLLKLK